MQRVKRSGEDADDDLEAQAKLLNDGAGTPTPSESQPKQGAPVLLPTAP